MNAAIALMLLVSCSDNFSTCNASDDMVQVYPTHEACEAALMPQVNRIGTHSELVFGKCLSANSDVIEGDLTIYWHIDQSGNFIVELVNDDNEQDVSTALNKVKSPKVNKVNVNKPSA